MKKIKLNIQKFAVSVSVTGNDGNVNVSANTSYISGTITISTSGQTHNYDSAYYQINGGPAQTFGIGYNETKQFSYQLGPYGHNADGSLGNQTVSVYVRITSSSTTSTSISVPMQTIPRASQPSINTWPNNSPNFNIGDTITIHMNRKADFRHKVYFVYGSTELLVAENVVDSCTFDTSTIANDLYELIPNSNVYSNVVRVQTYNGSTLVGTATCNYNAKVVNANPIFSDFTFEDINATTLALTGDSSVNINGYSTIEATISTINKATAQKEATMSKYMLTIGDKSVDIAYSDSESVSGSIQNAPNGIYNLYAIDSRGNTTLVTKLASQNIEYTPITFNSSSCKVERTNGGVGGFAMLTLSGNIWNGDFGEVENTITSISYQYKKTSETSWQTGPTQITPTIRDDKFTFEDEIGSNESGYTFDLQSSYDFRIIINDKLSTKSIQLSPMPSAVPNISLADDGVGIMCDYDENLGGALQIAGVKYEAPETDIFKFQHFSTSITIGANGMSTANMGTINIPSGYTYAGMLSHSAGYGDQWVVSFSKYINNAYAMAHSKINQTLTNTIECTAVFVKTTYYNNNLVS